MTRLSCVIGRLYDFTSMVLSHGDEVDRNLHPLV